MLAYEERVLNDAEPSDGDASSKSTQQQRGKRIRTAVLAVAEVDTTRVMLGASLGELRLALRGAQVADSATTIDGLPTEMTDTSSLPLEAQQVITLRELAAVKKQKQSQPGISAPEANAPPPVVIYRGSDVQRVNR